MASVSEMNDPIWNAKIMGYKVGAHLSECKAGAGGTVWELATVTAEVKDWPCGG